MRKGRPQPEPYKHSKYSPWMVVVPRNFNGTKRQRFFFKTPEEAQFYCDNLSPANYASLEPHPMTAGGRDRDPKLRSLESCVREWLRRFQNHKPTLLQCRQKLKPLVARFGRQPIKAITIQHLEDHFRSLEKEYAFESRKNSRRRIRQFFDYCHDIGWLGSKLFLNPILKQPKRREPLKRFIITPDEMRQCLEAAKENRTLMAFLCLGGFSGLRPSEILKMDWDHIRWEDNEICVPEGKPIDNPNEWEIGRSVPVWEQNLARRVMFEYNKEGYCSFRARLEPFALKGREINRAEQRRPDGGRGSRKIIPGGQAKLYHLLKPLRPILGVDEWPKDCLRHSYKSYHLAYFQNFERLRVQMGHASVSMTERYGSPQRQREAADWWAL